MGQAVKRSGMTRGEALFLQAGELYVCASDNIGPTGNVGVVYRVAFNGACCNYDGTCESPVLEEKCLGQGEIWVSGATCEEADCAAVPTVSEWGLIVMTLLGCTIGTLVYRGRRALAA